MKKYKTSIYRLHIETVEVARETGKSIVVIGFDYGKPYETRALKRSSTANYFDSWDEAKQFLIESHEAKLKSARRQLQVLQDNFGNVKGLKRPPDEP